MAATKKPDTNAPAVKRGDHVTYQWGEARDGKPGTWRVE